MSPDSANPDHPFSRPFDALEFEKRLRCLDRREPFLFPQDIVPIDFKRSSVLICFWREETDLRVLLTKCASTLRGHPGQMSFPGGRLDDAWSGASHLLVPVVGWLDAPPTFSPNPDEVEAIHTPSVSGLFAPDVFTREEADLGGDVYYNSTLRWKEGSVFGLSSNLLIEVIQWAIGFEAAHGPGRLSSLESWLRLKAN